MDPKIIFLIAMSAVIVTEVGILGWMLTKEDSEDVQSDEAQTGAMVQERKPYLQFMFADSFGRDHGEFSLATHEVYYPFISDLEEMIKERRQECSHEEKIFPDYPECSESNNYGFYVADHETQSDFFKPCLYLRIEHAEKLAPSAGKLTEDAYSVLCRALLFENEESMEPVKALQMNVFPPDGLKRKVFPLAENTSFCSPIVAVQLDLNAIHSYARVEAECEIFVEESTSFDRRKAELKLDINLSSNDGTDALLQEVLASIKENADTLANLAENSDFVEKMEELQKQLSASVDELRPNSSFAPDEQHLKALEKAIEEYQAEAENTSVIKHTDSKLDDLKSVIAESTSQFLENVRSNSTKLRKILHEMVQQISNSESSEQEQNLILNQIKDISQTLSWQKGDDMFEQGLVRLAPLLFTLLEEYSKSDSQKPAMVQATNRTREAVAEYIQHRIETRLNNLHKDVADPRVSQSRKRRVKKIIELVERLRKKAAQKSNGTVDDAQLLSDFELLTTDLDIERSAGAINVEGSDEQYVDEQKKEFTRLLGLLVPKPNQRLEPTEQHLEKAKEDLEAQVALIPSSKKKRKIKQIITIIDQLRRKANSSELNSTLADQLGSALENVSRSFVMTDAQLDDLVDQLYSISDPVSQRNETSQLQKISEIATAICPVINNYNCTIADEEEALGMLQELTKKPNIAIEENAYLLDKLDELVDLLQEINDLEEDQEANLITIKDGLGKIRSHNKKKKTIKKIFELHESNRTAYPASERFKEILANLSDANFDTQSVSPAINKEYNDIMKLLSTISDEPKDLRRLLLDVDANAKREAEKIIRDLIDFIETTHKNSVPETEASEKMKNLLAGVNYVKESVAQESKDGVGNISRITMGKDNPRQMADFLQNVTRILGIEEAGSNSTDRSQTFKQFLEKIVKDDGSNDFARSQNQELMKHFLEEIAGLNENEKIRWRNALSTTNATAAKENLTPYVQQFIDRAEFLLRTNPDEVQPQTTLMSETATPKTRLQGEEYKNKLIQIISKVEPLFKSDQLSDLLERKEAIQKLSPDDDLSEHYSTTADIIVAELEEIQDKDIIVEGLLKKLNESEWSGNSKISERLLEITDEIERNPLPELRQRSSEDYDRLLRVQEQLMNMVETAFENTQDLVLVSKNLTDLKEILNRNSFNESSNTVEDLVKTISDEISFLENKEKLRNVLSQDNENRLQGAGFQEIYNSGQIYLSNNKQNRNDLKDSLLKTLDDMNNSTANLTYKSKVKILRTLLEELRSSEPNETVDGELSIKQLSFRKGVPNILLKRLDNILKNASSDNPSLKQTIKELLQDLIDQNNEDVARTISLSAKPSLQTSSGLTPTTFVDKLSMFENAVATDAERGRLDGETFDSKRRDLGKDLEKIVRPERLKQIEHLLNYPTDMSLLLPTFQMLNLLNKGNLTCDGITMQPKNIEQYKDILRQESLEDSPLFDFLLRLDSSLPLSDVDTLNEIAVEVIKSPTSHSFLVADKELSELVRRAAACSANKIVQALVEDLAMIQRTFTAMTFSEELARNRMRECYPNLPIHLLGGLTFQYLTEAPQTAKLLETFAVKVKNTLASFANDTISTPAQATLSQYLSIMSSNETITIDAETADQLRKILRTYQAEIITSTSLTQSKVEEILAKLDFTESLIRLSVRLSIVSESVNKILTDGGSTESKRLSSLKLLYQKTEEAQHVLQLRNEPTVSDKLRSYILDFNKNLKELNQSCEEIASSKTSLETMVQKSDRQEVEYVNEPTEMKNHKIIPHNGTIDATAICRLLRKHPSCADVCKNITVFLEMMKNQETGKSLSHDDDDEDKQEGETSGETLSSSEDAETVDVVDDAKVDLGSVTIFIPENSTTTLKVLAASATTEIMKTTNTDKEAVTSPLPLSFSEISPVEVNGSQANFNSLLADAGRKDSTGGEKTTTMYSDSTFHKSDPTTELTTSSSTPATKEEISDEKEHKINTDSTLYSDSTYHKSDPTTELTTPSSTPATKEIAGEKEHKINTDSTWLIELSNIVSSSIHTTTQHNQSVTQDSMTSMFDKTILEDGEFTYDTQVEKSSDHDTFVEENPATRETKTSSTEDTSILRTSTEQHQTKTMTTEAASTRAGMMSEDVFELDYDSQGEKSPKEHREMDSEAGKESATGSNDHQEVTENIVKTKVDSGGFTIRDTETTPEQIRKENKIDDIESEIIVEEGLDYDTQGEKKPEEHREEAGNESTTRNHSNDHQEVTENIVKTIVDSGGFTIRDTNTVQKDIRKENKIDDIESEIIVEETDETRVLTSGNDKGRIAETTDDDEYEYELVTEIIRITEDEEGRQINEEKISKDELDSILKSNTSSADGVRREIKIKTFEESHSNPKPQDDPFEKNRQKMKEQALRSAVPITGKQGKTNFYNLPEKQKNKKDDFYDDS